MAISLRGSVDERQSAPEVARPFWPRASRSADAAIGRDYKRAGEKTKTPGARPGVRGWDRFGGVDQKLTRTPVVKAVLFGSVQAVFPLGRVKPLAKPP